MNHSYKQRITPLFKYHQEQVQCF